MNLICLIPKLDLNCFAITFPRGLEGHGHKQLSNCNPIAGLIILYITFCSNLPLFRSNLLNTTSFWPEILQRLWDKYRLSYVIKVFSLMNKKKWIKLTIRTTNYEMHNELTKLCMYSKTCESLQRILFCRIKNTVFE